MLRSTLPLLTVALFGCAGDPSSLPPLSDPTIPDRDDDGVSDDDDSATDDDDTPSPCPSGMAAVTPSGGTAFCIDRFEGALEVQVASLWVPRTPYGPLTSAEVVRAVPADGLVPQAYISGDEASAACLASAKRLCSAPEWLAACRGPDNTVWPYGATYVAGACNDTYPGGHPVVDYFGTNQGIWNMTSMNDPGINQQADTVDAGGTNTGCVSHWGAFDLHGNLHEWVDDPAGTFRGGFFADAEINGAGCTYATTAHPMSYHDYSTGFRCCL